MVRRVEYHGGARTDFDDAVDWYTKYSERAALGFVAAVEDAITRILADPGRFPRTKAGCQFCLLKRYPFRIVFRVELDRLEVIAVAHAKRKPG